MNSNPVASVHSSPTLWYLHEWMQRDRYHAVPCVQKKVNKKRQKKNGCVEIQILSMARGNEGLSAFIVASPSWLAWSPWQITSAWPRHRQPPNPGRVALKGLNVKPLRSAHHIASAAALRSLARVRDRKHTGQRETSRRAPRRKTKTKHRRHSLFCSTGVSWGGGGRGLSESSAPLTTCLFLLSLKYSCWIRQHSTPQRTEHLLLAAFDIQSPSCCLMHKLARSIRLIFQETLVCVYIAPSRSPNPVCANKKVTNTLLEFLTFRCNFRNLCFSFATNYSFSFSLIGCFPSSFDKDGVCVGQTVLFVSTNLPQHKHVQIRWTGNSLHMMFVDVCLSLCVSSCDELAVCLGRHLSSPPRQLRWTPASPPLSDQWRQQGKIDV